jgi:ABC-2 type transport system ATP-binding protein
MIQVDRLTKLYGHRLAVDSLSFSVAPGIVTGFLGPNGSGKSTTMRLILGLDRPTSGKALIDGRSYADLPDPIRRIGSLLEGHSAHPSRTAFDHLLAIAATHRIPRRRVHEVIDFAGLGSVANKKIGSFSLGMGQRVGIAAALLGDPQILMLDEPVNGLDPEGVLWVRRLCRDFAAAGRTVFLSSHLMSEMALVADRVIILGRGRILADTSLDDLLTSGAASVRVRSLRTIELSDRLVATGAKVSSTGADTLEVTGLSAAAIGELAASIGIALHELADEGSTLENAYLALTANAVEFRSVHPEP